MALTVFETVEQRLPVHVGQGDGGKVGGDGERAVQLQLLQETDHGGDVDDRPERDDVWKMIQSQRPAPAAPAAPAKQAPYVHPLVRRSSSLLSQKSLEICTESLGSETGSDGFSDATDRSSAGSDDDDGEESADEVATRAPPPRAFPPPLPSLARRTVGALQMRQHRRDGRLVVEAVTMPSPTLFRAQRRGGRLLLSFADTVGPASDEDKTAGQEPELQDNEQTPDPEEDDDEEEEVEVVDRGTVVEVKVSMQPQARSGSGGGGSSGARVHRSALVVNKFVSAEPAVATSEVDGAAPESQHPSKPPRRPAGSTTTAAAALAAASALSATAAPLGAADGGTAATPGESKLLTTATRRRSKEELLNYMRRRCGHLSGQLFIWEPCIATSS